MTVKERMVRVRDQIRQVKLQGAGLDLQIKRVAEAVSRATEAIDSMTHATWTALSMLDELEAASKQEQPAKLEDEA